MNHESEISRPSPNHTPYKYRVCPGCGEKGGMKKILYGMPDDEFDFEKYIVGGCIVTGSDPQVGCTKCGWEGEHKSEIWFE